MQTPHRDRHRSSANGFTLLELVFVIAIVAVIIALLLASVRSSRGAARRMSCSNNLKLLGLALHNYHDAHGYLPAAISGNANRLSGLVSLLPFIEQQALWEQISTATEFDGTAYPAMGPAPWDSTYPPWQRELPNLRCPSAEGGEAGFGRTNYTFSIDDVARQIHEPTILRGAFAGGMTSRFDDITDGTSHTMAMAEIGTPAGRAVVGQFATQQPRNVLEDPIRCRTVLDASRPQSYAQDARLSPVGRGGRWADGAAGFSLVNTVLPPNNPSCAVGGMEAVDGIYSAGSFHPGGTQVLLTDGSVRFISEDIDAGDQRHPTPSPEQLADGTVVSPYGVWGALGTAAGEDKAEPY